MVGEFDAHRGKDFALFRQAAIARQSQRRHLIAKGHLMTVTPSIAARCDQSIGGPFAQNQTQDAGTNRHHLSGEFVLQHQQRFTTGRRFRLFFPAGHFLSS